MDNCHARTLGIERRMEPTGDPINFKTTFIGTMDACENFSQSAFACTIFTHQRVTRPRLHIETDPLKRDGSGKPFADFTKTNGRDVGDSIQGNIIF